MGLHQAGVPKPAQAAGSSKGSKVKLVFYFFETGTGIIETFLFNSGTEIQETSRREQKAFEECDFFFF